MKKTATNEIYNLTLHDARPNQWESKKWLLDKVTDYVNIVSKVQLFGGWFAHPMCTLLTSAFADLIWIENTDIDEHALHVCRNINQELS